MTHSPIDEIFAPIILIPRVYRHTQSINMFPAAGETRYNVTTPEDICRIKKVKGVLMQ